jgi:hypothetical protein
VTFDRLLNAERGPDPEAPEAWQPGSGSGADVAMIEQFHEDARRRIEEAPLEEQHFFRRGDNGKIVQTQAEYARCARKRVPLEIVTFEEAREALEAEDAARKRRREKKLRRKGKLPVDQGA